VIEDVGLGQLALAVAVTAFACIPIGVSLWALLDAARRPPWAWALAGRRQVLWLAVIVFGVLTVVGGLAVSSYYLVSVRPRVAAAEAGDLRAA